MMFIPRPVQRIRRGSRAIPGSGWSFNANEGWLHHPGGNASSLPIRVRTALADGPYELVLGVYDDLEYRGKPYSRFLVDGRKYASPGSNIQGSTLVSAGEAKVQAGVCAFTLSSVAANQGVIIYNLGFKRLAPKAAADLYAVRAAIGDAIEALQAALGMP